MPHYLILDVEASGLFTYRDAAGNQVRADAPGQPRVAQIGMIHVNHKFEVEAEHEFLIRPEGWEMSEEATKVTGLTTEFLKANGGPIAEALALYNAGIDARRVIVGHNIDYDCKAMRAENRRSGLDDRYMQTRTICTMLASTDLCKIPPHGNRGGYKWPKLSEACVYFGIEQGADHTALADARNTLAIMLKLVERGALPEPKSPYDKAPKKKPKAAKAPKVGLPGDDPELDDDAQAEIPV